VEASAPLASAFKFNLAFYLAYGPEGLQALKETIAAAPDDIPTVLDAKFGDISYTAQHYARAAFEALRADAVTVAPYVGMDAVTPLLDYPEKGIYVLVRSANITGNDFQLWPSERAPLYRFVTAQLNTLAREHPDKLGLMVSATQPVDLARIRSWAPTLPFLVPGIGAQQGDLDTALAHGVTSTGLGPLLGMGRALVTPVDGQTLGESARTAAEMWLARIRERRAALAAAPPR